jgi:cation diffusion facilitator CzcD-associated flavoprotein CzcO
MEDHTSQGRKENSPAESLDVLIVGAGISGVGAAYHLTHQRPGTSFVILEALDGFGGTWRTHRYPGIRSDSELYTFGYRFKPWTGAPIATAEEIMKYMGEVIEENGLRQHIRYSHKIESAIWLSHENRWTIDARRTDTHEEVRFSAKFLWMCQGYYRHSKGYTPEWSGMSRYRGRIVHPQEWPKDLEYANKRVVVIGSGATAATIIPAMAKETSHITMLQRSPTYYFTGRNVNELADMLRELKIDESWIHEIVRRKILLEQAKFTRLCFDDPQAAKALLLETVRAHLPPDYDVQTHFTPRYLPWRQRLAVVPNGDLFSAIRAGKASVVTGEIESFNENGITLKSGEELAADIIITATGFNMSALGDVRFVIDGKPLIFSDSVTYRGMMFTGIPNMVWVFGYFRAAWTLRADLVADFVCRLLAHMEKRGAHRVTVALRPEDKDMEILPWVDPKDFNPGYLMRAKDILPKRGTKPEWQHTQDYWREKDELPAIYLDGREFQYL